MMGAPLPSGYDVSKALRVPNNSCQLTVGFDKNRGHIPRFVVRLHYITQLWPRVTWTTIARFDHNETPRKGHDVYKQGLHIDVLADGGPMVKLYPRHSTLPSNPGVVIQGCRDYLENHLDYLIDVYKGNRPPGRPPKWPP